MKSIGGRLKSERGAELIEFALIFPLLLLVLVGMIDFGFLFQRYEVLTNAAREGARIAVLPEYTDEQVTGVVRTYLRDGGLSVVDPTITRNVPVGQTTASRVTISYPFDFMVLNPVARLVRPASELGRGTLTMQATALMRNE